jgi:hypothetical protein
MTSRSVAAWSTAFPALTRRNRGVSASGLAHRAAAEHGADPFRTGADGYPFALEWTVGPALLAVVVVTAIGPEAKGAVFGHSLGIGTDPTIPTAPAATADPAEHPNLGLG